ncbi:hypothetical protein Lbir_1541 [Legionella birminghamensis]|uniref:Uncharacterized protein n=1 Tax=Legionella birminghamensis TaxID=28083 RepID=A0A378IC35_9GAMM|nr:hypothetical protein [Legionella birminghamensis]KTC71686.1 hypothetical protein Lbir_1541 [Legionella birminghamensis]STX32476.1 Uncharacterised protein [Legionella birminghamensis]
MGWKKLGEGAFNTVYVNDDKTTVLKIAKDCSATDKPERSVRIWNEINAHIKPSATVVDSPLGKGWCCPYIEGKQASDKEISQSVIDIFNRTGRIVIDAVTQKNILKTKDGELVCIDIGLAVQLEQREEVIVNKKLRRRSLVSQSYWHTYQAPHDSWFYIASFTRPQGVDTVKALLFIKANRPDMFDVSFLKDKPNLLKTLAAAYDAQRVSFKAPGLLAAEIVDHRAHKAIHPLNPLPPFKLNAKDKLADAVKKGNKVLLDEREINLDNLKESCLRELTRYFYSRGSLKKGEFQASLATRLFRNHALTATKAEYTKVLMDKINHAVTLDEIKQIINKSLSNGLLTMSSHKVSLAVRLARCSVMCELARPYLNDVENKHSYTH